MGILDTILSEQKKEETNHIKQFNLIGSRCPHCKNGKMYIRQSKFGDFLGCNNYPKCAYTINVKYNNDSGTAGHRS